MRDFHLLEVERTGQMSNFLEDLKLWNRTTFHLDAVCEHNIQSYKLWTAGVMLTQSTGIIIRSLETSDSGRND